MKKILFMSLLLISGLLSNAQCDQKLLEKAKESMREHEVMLKDYKIKLDAASIDDPAPIAIFKYKLEKGKHYRLRILSDSMEYSSKGILRLFDDDTFVGTTYVAETKRHYDSFDFMCKKTSDYRLLVTFQDGKPGCAVVIVNEVE